MLKSARTGEYLEEYGYNANRNIVSVKSSKLEKTSYEYDTTNPNLLTKAKTYELAVDSSGSITETLISTTSYTYNTYGLCTKVTATASGTTLTESYSYITTSNSKIFGALQSYTDHSGNTTTYFRNLNNGMVEATISGNGYGLAYTYDNFGNVLTVMPAEATSSSYSKETTAESVTYTYNSKEQLSGITTESTEYGFTYDSFGNPAAVDIGGEDIVSYAYGSNNGKLASVTYANGLRVNYYYNALELLEKVCYTTGGSTTTAYEYEYTSGGQISLLKDNISGKTTVYRYDRNGRLVYTKEYENDSLDMSYFSEYSYDEFERLHQSHNRIYSDIGTNQSVYTYSYNTDNTLSSIYLVTEGARLNFSYTYDSLDRITQKTYDAENTSFTNNITYTYSSTKNRVTTYTSKINGTQTAKFDYGYNINGDISAITSYGSATKNAYYYYDNLGQLVEEINEIYGYDIEYTYDNAGNVTKIESTVHSSSGGGGGMIIRALGPIGALNRTFTYTDSQWGDLLTSVNGTTITYDAIGNPVSYYNGKGSYTFTWRGRQMKSALHGGKTYTFTHNDEGLRTSKTVNGVTTEYIYEGTRLIAEVTPSYMILYMYDESGLPMGMQYKASGSTSWTVYYYERNLQGDVIALYSSSGTKLVTYTYDAYGNATVLYSSGSASTPAAKNPFRYRGYYYDLDLSMYLLGTRYYDSQICRFISPDSALYHNMIGYNMFAYCNNNPVNYYDPTGENAASLFWYWITYGGSFAAVEPTPVGEIIVGVGIAVIGGIWLGEKIAEGVHFVESVIDAVKDAAPQSITEPEDAVDENGNPVVKPGQQPTEKDGYIAPKGGPVKGKSKDGKIGWMDKNGNIWVPAPTGSSIGHGGGHWDVQSPKGGYSNVYPGGKVRGGKSPYPNIKIFP